MTDLTTRLEQGLASAWRPDQGDPDLIVGTVTDIDWGSSEYNESGRYPIVTVATEPDGEEKAVHGFHTVLMNELLRQKPQPGERILDVCAAPGGKSAMLGRDVGARGLLVSCDTRPARLTVLKHVLRHEGVPARVARIDATQPLPFGAIFDRVLLDAPCSGLGTIGRDPDVKWSRQPDSLPRFAATQTAMIRQAAATVAPGGRLVYAGAGTAGRLGVLDASEIPPTFGVAPDLVVGLIAGGPAAVTTAVEGAEDDAGAAVADLDRLAIGERDCVVAVAASGRTPYPVAAARHALAAILDGFVTPVERARGYLVTSEGEAQELDEVVLAGSGACLPGLQDALADRLGTPVTILDPLRELEVDPAIRATLLDPAARASMAIPVGLGLREEG